jgi:hypothetical protein
MVVVTNVTNYTPQGFFLLRFCYVFKKTVTTLEQYEKNRYRIVRELLQPL